jgi:acyl-CoA synthetase (AMP-forming)/AMP-acid ligase II
MFWAGVMSGAAVSILQDNLPIEKTKTIINNNQPSFIICTSQVLDSLLKDNYEINCKVIVADYQQSTTQNNKINIIEFENLLNYQKEAVTLPRIISTDLASIIYTSGSTGEPKGIMMQHHNMVVAVESISSYLNYETLDVIIVALPLAFDYGFYQHLLATKVGAAIILYDSLLWIPQILKDFDDLKPTILPGTTTLYNLLYQFKDKVKFDGRTINKISNTGMRLGKHHMEMIKALFPKTTIYSMYGLTECKRCSYLPPQYLEAKPESIGIPIPNLEMDVFDKSGNVCKPYEIGEFVVRGQTIMQGYFKDDDKTKNVLGIHPIFGDKCLYTGDFGYKDEEGFFYLQGRQDDMIKYRGYRFYPCEIEDIIMKHSGINEAAVLNIEFGTTQKLVAFVGTKNKQFSNGELISFLKKKLVSYQMPEQIIILQELPKNSNSKIDKIKLRELL